MKLKSWLRTSLFVVAAVVALLASGPMLPVEMAVWFSGELLIYLEVISGVWLTSQVSSWKSLFAGFRGKAAQARRYIHGGWARSHPSFASWVQWTFATI